MSEDGCVLDKCHRWPQFYSKAVLQQRYILWLTTWRGHAVRLALACLANKVRKRSFCAFRRNLSSCELPTQATVWNNLADSSWLWQSKKFGILCNNMFFSKKILIHFLELFQGFWTEHCKKNIVSSSFLTTFACVYVFWKTAFLLALLSLFVILSVVPIIVLVIYCSSYYS